MPITNEKLDLLKRAFDAGLACVMADQFMPDVVKKLTQQPLGTKRHLLACGKAARAMARAYFASGGHADSSLIVMPYLADEEDELRFFAGVPDVQIIKAAHPVPDQNSARAAQEALALAHRLGPDDELILLLSGGGSSLLSAGLAGVSLEDKKALNDALLASGMPIQEMNIIRKHVSAVKGGRLALAAYPAHVRCFALSDVPGDDPSAIASGPTIPDDSTAEMARGLIADYQLELPQVITKILRDDALCETPFSHDPQLANARYEIVGSASIALHAAGKILKQAGYQTVILGDHFQQSASDLADYMCALCDEADDGTAFISGGETSVVTGEARGVGGRNAQFALEMVMRARDDICGLSCDTDGIDGAKAVAGALFYEGMRQEAEERHIAVTDYYKNLDSHSFFEIMGTQIITGPTETNVNDLRIILKGNPAS